MKIVGLAFMVIVIGIMVVAKHWEERFVIGYVRITQNARQSEYSNVSSRTQQP